MLVTKFVDDECWIMVTDSRCGWPISSITDEHQHQKKAAKNYNSVTNILKLIPIPIQTNRMLSQTSLFQNIKQNKEVNWPKNYIEIHIIPAYWLRPGCWHCEPELIWASYHDIVLLRPCTFKKCRTLVVLRGPGRSCTAALEWIWILTLRIMHLRHDSVSVLVFSLSLLLIDKNLNIFEHFGYW